MGALCETRCDMSEVREAADGRPQGEIAVYQAADGKTRIEVHFVDESVWLTQQQMADLFQTSRTNVVEHIRHICLAKNMALMPCY